MLPMAEDSYARIYIFRHNWLVLIYTSFTMASVFVPFETLNTPRPLTFRGRTRLLPFIYRTVGGAIVGTGVARMIAPLGYSATGLLDVEIGRAAKGVRS